MKDGERKLISQVVILLKLIMVAPTTNAESERIFSAMKRIKTYLRNRMTNERMNSLMIMHVHRDRLDDLDFISIGNDFVGKNQRRRNTFGIFNESDIANMNLVNKHVEVSDVSTQTEK